MFNFCIDCTCLSVNKVNAIGESSNFSSQHRTEFHCALSILLQVFSGVSYALFESKKDNIDRKNKNKEKKKRKKNTFR